MQVVTQSSWALGSDVSITALHPRAEAAEAALSAAFDQLALVEELMSIYRPQSQLNRAGILDDPHPYLVEVLRRARAMSRRSGGAFDVTVQPLWQVFREAQKKGVLPAPSAVEAARTLVNWRDVEISASCIRMRRAAMAVTLNGIAQGFAADKVMETLRAAGVQHALVDTGQSPPVVSSVSVAARTATEADALSTAVFVLGPEKGLKLVRSLPGADAMLVRKDGTIQSTDAFPTEA